MARRIVHQLIDDLDGTVLEPGDGETVLFSIDGTAYEIDLTAEHAAALRAALEPFVAGGRALSAPGGRRPRASRAGAHRTEASTSHLNLGAVREWARDNGYSVSDRGRVPSTVIAAYEASH